MDSNKLLLYGQVVEFSQKYDLIDIECENEEDFFINNDDDLCYQLFINFVIEQVFKWCGCSSPDEAYDQIHKILKLLKIRNDIEYEEYKEKLNEITGNYGNAMIIFYVLDEKGLTEHGGGVGGSWLYCKGEELFELMNDYEKLLGGDE